MKTPKKEQNNHPLNDTTNVVKGASNSALDSREVNAKIQNLHTFVRNELPILNKITESGAHPITKLLSEITKAVSPIIVTFKDIPRFDMLEAKEAIDFFKLLKLIGFCGSSIEKHSQSSGEPPGRGIQQIAGFETLLLKLGQYLNHPPRDSHYTEWISNSDPNDMLTFTGDDKEKFFNRVVNAQSVSHETSSILLSYIADGTVSINSRKAAQVLRLVYEELEGLYKEYQAFKHNPITGEPNMTADFFIRVLRQYLLPYPVGGSEPIMGPNPTNVVFTPILDFVIGTVNKEYTQTIIERSRFMSQYEANLVKGIMSKPSVFDKLLQELGLERSSLTTISKKDLYYRLIQQSAGYFKTLDAFKEVQKMSAHISAYHFQLIMNYLVRAADMYSPEEISKWPVKPNAGVGGKSHDHTKSIMDMRRKDADFDILYQAASHIHY